MITIAPVSWKIDDDLPPYTKNSQTILRITWSQIVLFLKANDTFNWAILTEKLPI